MLVSLLCLIAVLAIVILAAKLKKHYKLNTQDLTPKQIRKLNHIHKVKEISLIESFYEMVFSSTSVLLFLSLYYIIDERIPQAALYWQKYQNIISVSSTEDRKSKATRPKDFLKRTATAL